MKIILFTIFYQLKILYILLNPIIPIATGKVLTSMNLSIDDISIKSIINKNVLNHDKELKNLEILFKKIENDN